MYKSFSFIVNL